MTHRVERLIETTCPPERAFDFVADFSTSQQWDPSIPSARRLDDGPIAVGSRFEVVFRFNDAEQIIIYEITELDRPSVVTLAGESDRFVGTDRISFAPIGTGTTVSYVADMGLKGLARLAEPFIKGRLESMSDHSIAGMKASLDALS